MIQIIFRHYTIYCSVYWKGLPYLSAKVENRKQLKKSVKPDLYFCLQGPLIGNEDYE